MKILIADDHPLYREALRTQVERLFPEAAIVEFPSFEEVMRLGAPEDGAYRLFLLDFHMPGMTTESLKALVETFPEVPVAVVSGTANRADVRAVIQAGARGFIPKTANAAYLSHALQLLLAGGTSVPADMLMGEEPAPPQAAPSSQAQWMSALSARELDVLRRVARGLSNKEIGRELDLAEVTVKLHLRSIFRKIGARTRSEAAVIATKANVG
jgi:DNA-binding NarL/FixJ family response regulator